MSGMDQMSMNYPQMAVLFQLQQQLAAKNKIFEDTNYRDQLKNLLSQAARFPVPAIQKKAEEIQAQQNP
jgi:hypothetical protein